LSFIPIFCFYLFVIQLKINESKWLSDECIANMLERYLQFIYGINWIDLYIDLYERSVISVQNILYLIFNTILQSLRDFYYICCKYNIISYYLITFWEFIDFFAFN